MQATSAASVRWGGWSRNLRHLKSGVLVEPHSFFEEMKRYIGFSPDDAETLRSLAPVVEPHLPALAERFYAEIPRHASAAGVFTGGTDQIARLKGTLQKWARGLFTGIYDEAYAHERFRIGFRHVQIALPQRYVISAVSVVEHFLRDLFDREITDPGRRGQAHRSLSRILNLDLNLICETYFEGSLRELRHLNDTLTATNRSLEQANRVKSEFLATVSHELRTPLTAIVGFSRLLAEGQIDDPARQLEFTRDIHTSALSLLGLVDEILDVARIEAGRLEITLASVDVAGVVREVVAEQALEASRKGLELTNAIPLDLPDVRADAERLKQILTNLVANAIKFTDQGFVRVGAGVVSDANSIVLTIEDSGIGISPEVIPTLFEKFKQADASYSRRHAGVGLGLAISKTLVDKMSGTISLHSAGPGTGTTARVTLAMAVVAQPAERRATRMPTRQVRVLLVADDHTVRRSVANELTTRGYIVREGATVDGARALAVAERPEVLVLDMGLSPDPTVARRWCEFLIELQIDPRTSAIQMIVLTDAAIETMRVELSLLLTPRATVLQWPADAATLHDAVQRAVTETRRPTRLLVVDDDPLVFKFASQVLPKADYALLYATSGREALAMLAAHPIDAILLDLRMPDGSGYDLIRDLKLREHPSHVPIVVLTNYPEPTSENEKELLQSHVVLELFSKATVARNPHALVDRLARLPRHS